MITPYINNANKIEISEWQHGPLTHQDYLLLRDAMIESKLTDARNVLLIQMLRATGVRIAELLRLTPSGVSRRGPAVWIAIYRGKQRGIKKGSYEWIPLPAVLGSSLLTFIESNRIQPDQRIIRITPKQVQNIFRRAGFKAIGRLVTPHEMRHLYIKSLIDGGLQVEVVSKMVGHSDIKTTLRYYYELTEEQRHEIQSRIQV